MFLLAFCLSVTVNADNEGPDRSRYSELTSENHPRVIYNGADFLKIRDLILDGSNPYVSKMHVAIMDAAAGCLERPPLERRLVGRRLLAVSREAMTRMVFCAYAFRTTGDIRYLNKAEDDIRTVCGFEDWNAERHFLDAGEMAAGVGLAYDWLYNDLGDGTKVMARKALNDFAFNPALGGESGAVFYGMKNNWNFVCNAGLVCAALATYEDNPEIARTIVEKAMETNGAAMEAGYSPDGNYLEGYGYWNYGTSFETLLLTALETATGDDGGLSSTEGFSKTGRYMTYMEGPSGQCFNYSDSGQSISGCLPLWYFAWKFRDLSCLFPLRGRETRVDRMAPLYVWCASRVGMDDIPSPETAIFHGEGGNPVVLVHDTWTMDERDSFLGVKAGKASCNHGHMDAGSFVFDADGVRWASDLGMENYTRLESYLGNIWDMSDGSDRWKVFRYNNFNHNTLTVNGTLHKAAGEAMILDTINSGGRKGAAVDLSAPLEGEVASAVRTIFIEGRDLVVEDRIVALDDKSAEIRWTLVTPAEPAIDGDTVILRQGDQTRRLTCASSGREVSWNIWSAQSQNPWDAPNKGFYECGYTCVVDPGDTAVITVRMSPCGPVPEETAAISH